MRHARKRAISMLLLGLLAFVCLARAAPAPEAVFNTDQGNLRLADLRGKVVYLDFWAAWCSPCRSSFPWMNEMHARYADKGLVVLAVNLDKDPKELKAFLAQMPAQFRLAYDPQGKVAEQYQLKGMPSSYLIDRQGQIHQVHVGFRDKDKAELEASIRQLIAK